MRGHRSTFAPGVVAITASLLAFVAVPIAAEDLDGEMLYATKTCIACHGKDAKSPILPVYPKLAGQNQGYLLQQMHDIKSGARNNANSVAMAGVMHLVSDAEMEALAGYIASLAP